MDFPTDFLWGAATASYQIEGATMQDGRGPSIWDTFSHTSGRVQGGDTGDVAADHYHRWRDDVAMMADLGLRAYRFSIAWPRVQPDGRGAPNQAGLDFYRRLVDDLRSHDIEPWVTLYHWDLPQVIEDAGGWPVRETTQRFAAYATLVHDALGDSVRCWTTLNEPWCSAFLGYAAGVHAPGRTEPRASLLAAHHLLLGHGLAVQALKAVDPTAQVGITLNLYAVTPATDASADLDAARRIDGLANRWFLDPLLRGAYPADILADVTEVIDPGELADPGDLAVIAEPLDFLGINYYTRHTVSGGRGGNGVALPDVALPDAALAGVPLPAVALGPSGSSSYPGSEHVEFVQGGRPLTDMGWEIDPGGLVEVLTTTSALRPGLPLYVTENGAAFPDEVASDGAVHDVRRVEFLSSHLAACHAALSAGLPLRGYFVWSLMDNFEWSYGYSKRFGIVHVDYATQRRRLKDSALFYRRVISEGALPRS